MSHNTKLWVLVGVLTVIWFLRFVIVPAMSQPYPGYNGPYGPPRYQWDTPYRGRGFERDYRDYRDDGYRNWAPPPRQTYRSAYPYQGRPYIGHWPSYGPWER